MPDLTEAERTQLAGSLSCPLPELDAKVAHVSDAATEEYLRMILGQRVLTRGQDIREYRLFLMIVHVFGNRLPSEQSISDLFQTTTTQSRALLRAVMSKYQYELQAAIHTSLADVLSGAAQDADTGTWSVTVDSESIIENLNRRLASIDGTLPPISKSRGTVIRYEIDNSAYQKLKDFYG